MKKKYVAPRLQRVGKFEVVTQASGVNKITDKVFPVGTPNDQLTFS
jgi:hypothetical protein